jgi:hypothetical protein
MTTAINELEEKSQEEKLACPHESVLLYFWDHAHGKRLGQWDTALTLSSRLPLATPLR